jgi:hypothetical protein
MVNGFNKFRIKSRHWCRNLESVDGNRQGPFQKPDQAILRGNKVY